MCWTKPLRFQTNVYLEENVDNSKHDIFMIRSILREMQGQTQEVGAQTRIKPRMIILMYVTLTPR